MKKWKHCWKKVCACFMAAVTMAASVLPGSARAETQVNEQASSYRNGVFERYEEYQDGSYNYTGLTDDSAFLASLWADEVKSMTTEEDLFSGYSGNVAENIVEFSRRLDQNALAEVNSAILWAGHHLTDTELDAAAYVDYLSKLVAMHEKGFLETAQSQAEYAIRVNVGEEVCNLIFYTTMEVGVDAFSETVSLKWKDVVSEDTWGNISEMLDAIKIYAEYGKTLVASAEINLNISEASQLLTYLSLQEEKLRFLETISEYADEKEHKELKAAAEELLNASLYQMAALVMTDVSEYEGLLSSAWDASAEAMDLPDTEELLVKLGDFVNSKAAKLLEQAASNLGGAWIEVPAYGLKCLGTAASSATSVLVGLEIGGYIGRIFMGDRYEMARQILIMDEIADVLSEAIPKYNDAYETAKSNKDEDAQYEAVKNLVAATEALCYTRLSGEYAEFEYAKGTKDAPSDEELDQKYSATASWLNLYYQSLAKVFQTVDLAAQVKLLSEYYAALNLEDISDYSWLGDMQCWVSDYDQNGLLELNLSQSFGTSCGTEWFCYEVNEDATGVNQVESDQITYMPDNFTNLLSESDNISDLRTYPCYYEESTGLWYYIMYDYLRGGAYENAYSYYAMTKQDTSLNWTDLGCIHNINYNDGTTTTTYTIGETTYDTKEAFYAALQAQMTGKKEMQYQILQFNVMDSTDLYTDLWNSAKAFQITE